jgi:hypothetical protein
MGAINPTDPQKLSEPARACAWASLNLLLKCSSQALESHQPLERLREGAVRRISTHFVQK